MQEYWVNVYDVNGFGYYITQTRFKERPINLISKDGCRVVYRIHVKPLVKRRAHYPLRMVDGHIRQNVVGWGTPKDKLSLRRETYHVKNIGKWLD